ncbi:M15 family metallopeptidase [Desulfovibrio legallii]|uniref:D-alanyl-D-alanine carboxypeptidase n=1 Tax=Desulfovibrio legallii TaxID=571438 RepID=A0A1G7N0U6_9BACT|nr:M15 family metallopeptidase [Desulfovibrio legallii]SDF67551.1 D-alanyl-D-alanine carboxypeptidase [Desulfovibrio legallii]
MARYLLFAVLLLCWGPCLAARAASEDAVPPSDAAVLARMDAAAVARLDLYCLRSAYPQITGFADDGEGRWLRFADGRRVLYAAPLAESAATAGLALSNPEADSLWDVDVRTSMAELYPLEPERPATPVGVSPGRRRSHALLRALYGETQAAVRARLRPARLLGQGLQLAEPAAQALNKADARLTAAVRADPALRPLLKVDGGFTWRRIAGTTRLSPHAFGIALDISPGIATYWRWSPLQPHPLQRGYPTAIVAAFEDAGFIWGGKWHEYDLMHFEYRPELLCKARVLRGLRKVFSPDADNY